MGPSAAGRQARSGGGVHISTPSTQPPAWPGSPRTQPLAPQLPQAHSCQAPTPTPCDRHPALGPPPLSAVFSSKLAHLVKEEPHGGEHLAQPLLVVVVRGAAKADVLVLHGGGAGKYSRSHQGTFAAQGPPLLPGQPGCSLGPAISSSERLAHRGARARQHLQVSCRGPHTHIKPLTEGSGPGTLYSPLASAYFSTALAKAPKAAVGR